MSYCRLKLYRLYFDENVDLNLSLYLYSLSDLFAMIIGEMRLKENKFSCNGKPILES